MDFLGLPARSVTITDTDLSTVSAAADKILIANADPRYVAHLELQSNYKDDDDERFMLYSVLAGRQTRLRVRTVAILLRPEADGPGMRRDFLRQFPQEPPYLQFRFRVVRMWEQPVEAILRGGIGLLPLAPLCDVGQEALPGVIRQMEQRIQAEAPDEAGILWSATYILMGLRFPRALAGLLLKGVRGMKESDTYQAILDEGKAIGVDEGKAIGLDEGKAIGLDEGKAIGLDEGKAIGLDEGKAIGLDEGKAKGEVIGERNAVLRLGGKRLGAPDAATMAILEAITSVGVFERLMDRLLEVETWRELLNGI